MLCLVLVVSYQASRKAGKAKPSQALRNLKNPVGSFNIRFKLPLDGDFPLAPWFALRFINNTIPNSISLILGFVGTFVLILFSINLYNSFESLEKNKTAWGFDESDLVLTRQSSIVLPLNHIELMDILRNQEKESIKTIIPFASLTAQIIDEDGQKQQIFGKVYSDSLSEAGLVTINGEHPIKEDQVALCIGTAKYHNKQIGDSILLQIEGFKKSFLVTSIYQDISAFGQGFRLHQNAMLPLNPLYEPTSYGLVIENDAEADSIKKHLLAHLGETVTVEGSIESRRSIVGLLQSMKLGILSISILFTLILLVIIGNDSTLQIKQNDMVYAQLKSIGFHSNQLRRIISIRVMILFAIGLIMAIPLGFMLGKPFAQILASGLGIQDFPFYISPSSIVLVYAVLFLFVLAICWFTSKLITKINPRKLVEI
jgi:putative ABC transport system permease protein